MYGTLLKRFSIVAVRFLPRDAMHKRGICYHPVSVRHVRELRAKTNKDIF